MLYYRAKGDFYDYFNNYEVIRNELLTAKERNRKCRYLSDNCFEAVNISKKDIYFSFGVRFQIGTNASTL